MKQPALGTKITELRKQKGLTQEELVARCNINVRTLQRIENGEVSPRSYTVKTILSALDHEYEDLYNNKEEQGDYLSVTNASEVKSIRFLLALAAISGILYLISGPFEGFADYYRLKEGTLVFGLTLHVIIKLISYITYAITVYGFLISGRLLNNYIMKVASMLLIVSLLLFYVYDITSLFYQATLPLEGIAVAESIIMGTLGVLFGIAILKSAKKLGALGYAAGGFEILASICFLTVLLAPLGLVLQFPAVLMEIVLLFKIRQMVRALEH